MPLPSYSAAKRYLELDLLRFVAILSVALVHFTYTFQRAANIGPSFYPIDRIARYAYLAIPLFFMISGYTVLRSARHKTVPQFFIARLIRLYPVFWFSCLLTFIGLRFSGMGGAPATVKQLLFNLTMLQEFFGQPSLNGVYWTLTYELTFYFLVSLIIAYQLWDHILLVIVGWMAYTLLVGPSASNTAFSFLFLPRYSPYLIAGMLFYVLQTQTVSAWKVYLALVADLGLALRSDQAEQLTIQAFYHEPVPYHPIICASIVTLFFGLFYVIISRRLTLPDFPLWGWLGRLTYPLYLLHTVAAVPLYLLNGKVNKYLLLGGSLVLVIGLAWVVHLLVEMPGSRVLGRRLAWASRPATPVPAEKAAPLPV